VLQSKETTLYKLQFGESVVALFTYEQNKTEFPLAVAWNRGEKHEIFWYSQYGWFDFDPKLFAKPKDIKIVDSK